MSLKHKLLGGIGFIFFSGIISLCYGLMGTKGIVDSVYSVKEDSFPSLESANGLNEMIRITNNAILLSIDGDDEFELEVIQAKEEFQKIIKRINLVKKDKELIVIERNYLDYVNDGIIFGRKMLKNQDQEIPSNFLDALADKRKLVTQSINQYLDSKTSIFESALQTILKQSSNFNRFLFIMSLIQLLMVIFLIIELKAISRDTDNMNESAHVLRQGNLEAEFNITREDELGVLQTAFENMRISLKDMVENLDTKVKERTFELAQAQKEIKDILDAIDQGIFTFNLNKSTNTVHSSRATEIFKCTNFKSTDLFKILKIEEKNHHAFEQWLKMISQPRFYSNWEQFKKLCPTTKIIESDAEGKERIIELDYQPILENDELSKIMVLGLDITEKWKTEQALQKTRIEQVAQMERVSALTQNDLIEIRSFLSDFDKTLQKIEMIKTVSDIAIEIQTLFREIHTLKGNSGIFELFNLTTLLNESENYLSDLRKEPDEDIFKKWKKSIIPIVEEKNKIAKVEKLFSSGNKGTMEIDAKRFKKILSELKVNKLSSTEAIYSELMTLNFKTFSVYCEKYAKLVTRISRNLNKDIENLIVENGDFLIPRNLMMELDDSIVHLIFNCLDHGIESNEERSALNKPKAHIKLSCGIDEGAFILEIEDNGKGISGDRIAEKALQKNMVTKEELAHMDENTKVQFIFQPGFSSKDSETMLSGRGVGLDVVNYKTKTLGGLIECFTEINEGTHFRMKFPKSLLEYSDS